MGLLPLRTRLIDTFLLNAVLLLFAVARNAYAQEAQTPPPYLAVVEGNVSLERATQVETAAAGVPLIAGDRVQTNGGRAELLFPDGTAIDLDENTIVDVQASGQIGLNYGRVKLVVSNSGDSSAASYEIDTPDASITPRSTGEYEVSVTNRRSTDETELVVFRGTATFSNDRGSLSARSGESVIGRADEPPMPDRVNLAQLDDFDRWSATLRDSRRGTGQSAQYLPSDLRMYGGSLDRSGSWSFEQQYGYVWYPTVASDWRPYYDGYWTAVPTIGWTWVGAEVWAWPTHHYGRWGYARSRWFWIPERHWSGAWVSWASAPDYIGWCPLGFDNRPVFGISLNVGNPWVGWSVVSRNRFASGRDAFVTRIAVPPHRIPRSTSFVVQRGGPALPPRAFASADRFGHSNSRSDARAGDYNSGRAVPRVWSNADRSAPRAGGTIGNPASPPAPRAVPRARGVDASGPQDRGRDTSPRVIERTPNLEPRQQIDASPRWPRRTPDAGSMAPAQSVPLPTERVYPRFGHSRSDSNPEGRAPGQQPVTAPPSAPPAGRQPVTAAPYYPFGGRQPVTAPPSNQGGGQQPVTAAPASDKRDAGSDRHAEPRDGGGRHDGGARQDGSRQDGGHQDSGRQETTGGHQRHR